MRLLPAFFRKIIRTGQLTLVEPGGKERVFGDGEGPAVVIRVNDAALDWKVVLNPELKFAEAYMDGTLVIEQGGILDFLTLFFRNRRYFDMSAAQIFRRRIGMAFRRFMQHNPISRARRNAAHHYDLGNEFYRMWLDADMQYSCGYWADGVTTLEQAQTAKKRHIAAKLALKPGQRVLDIGCGWGGMALYLATVADVHVTGVTLAKEQLAVAKRRAEVLGLSDRIDFRLQDYREVAETYDRVVSVGMLEHVGSGFLTRYFMDVRDRLAPDGVALIHSISSKTPPGVTSPFIRKYIFPGGYAPSLSETLLSVERSGLWVLDCEIWRVHYARTLEQWLWRFTEVRDRVVELYDERFARMWELYLAACICVFDYGTSHVFQLQLGRERDSVPLTRDYLGPAKDALAKREGDWLEKLSRSTALAMDGAPACTASAAATAT